MGAPNNLWSAHAKDKMRSSNVGVHARSAQSPGAARSRGAIVFTILVAASGCAKESTLAPDLVPSTSDVAQSVCSLPAIHADYDGKQAQIRGRFGGHAHGVFLEDRSCPGHMLTLESTDGGPDVSLCTPDRIAQEFGCPGGNHNGPIVTVVGILVPSKTPEFGSILVTEMRDFVNARTGERFIP
jgi:hypothetical protein